MASRVIPEPPESYLTKYNQYSIATIIATMMYNMGANVMQNLRWDNPNVNVYGPGDWRVNNQIFHLRPQVPLDDKHLTNHSQCHIKFTGLRYDPKLSNIQYGTRQIDKKLNEQLDGKSKIVTNKTDQEIDVSYTEEVSVTNSFSSSVTKGVTLDMSVEVASEQKVGGEYMGVSAEVSLSEKFGVDKSSSREESKEKSEEGTKSESMGISFKAAPQTNYLVEIDKEAQSVSEPFSINGVQDYAFEIFFGSHLYIGPEGHSSFTVKFASIDDYIQFLLGRDTDHPELQGWLEKYKSRAWDVNKAINFLQDPSHRRVVTSGINYSHLESNVDYNVQELGKNVPDNLAHVPVVSATDV